MKIIGVLLIIAAVALGLYVGGWLLFVKGIIDMVVGIIAIISACAAGTAIASGTASLIGFGLVKFLCGGVVGWLIFLFVAFIGGVFIAAGDETSSRKRFSKLGRKK